MLSKGAKWTLIFVIGCLLAVPTAASAHGHKSHHHTGKHHASVVKGNPWLEALVHNPEVQLGAGESSSVAKVYILAEEHIAGAKVNSPRCFWGSGWNSGEGVNGELIWFWDTHMKMCPNPNSPTGWSKVAGGITGRNCGNAVKPQGSPPGKVVEISQVRFVHSFGRFKARAHASENVKVHDWCGEASASAWAYAVAFGVTKAQAKGNAQFRASGEAEAQAHAKAIAILHCGTPPPPPPPPPCTPGTPGCETPPPCTTCTVDHAPQISCTFPPHVYVGESQFMWCEASDPDGDALSVNVVGDSHLQVSSTIPTNERWDGSQCPSGTHCYRSTLWGKSAGTATIVATVSANGKSAKAVGSVSVPEDEF